MPFRVARACLYASLLCALLATRVAVDFHSFRAKVVEHDPVVPVGGVAQVLLPADRTSRDLSPPFAVIARIHNESAAVQQFTIRIDGGVACVRSVPPSALQRIDCTWEGHWAVGAPHRIDVIGSGSWTLAYLELATHHGATRAYDLIIVPARSTHYVKPTLLWMLLACTGILLLFALPEQALVRTVARLHRAVSVAIGILLSAVFLSPYISSYALLLSRDAFVASICVLAAPRLWRAARWVRHRQREVRWPPRAKCLAYATIVLAVYGSVVVHHLREEFGGNYSGFLQISKTSFDGNPILSSRADVRGSLILLDPGGYDAEFMYFEAFDPFLRQYRNQPQIYRQFIDAPPYRYGRIGFVLLTKLLSADHWQLYPATMTWLILGSLFAAALSLAFIARSSGADPAWGLVIIFVPGFWQSLQASLPEPIAAACFLAGFLCSLHGRSRLAGALFGLCLLLRETGAIFVALVVTGEFIAGRRRRAGELALISFVPLVGWRLYVGSILYSDWGSEAFLFGGNNLGTPFAGMIDVWASIGRGEYFPGQPALSRAGIWYPIILTIGLAVAVMSAVRKRSSIAAAAVVYAVLAVSLTYSSVWVHVGNAQRTTFELFVALAIVSVQTRTDPQLFRATLVAFWAATAIYVFFGAFDAQYVRESLNPYTLLVYTRR